MKKMDITPVVDIFEETAEALITVAKQLSGG
jgi:hypothetical protein